MTNAMETVTVPLEGNACRVRCGAWYIRTYSRAFATDLCKAKNLLIPTVSHNTESRGNNSKNGLQLYFHDSRLMHFEPKAPRCVDEFAATEHGAEVPRM